VFVQQSLQPKLSRRCYGSVSTALQSKILQFYIIVFLVLSVTLTFQPMTFKT